MSLWKALGFKDTKKDEPDREALLSHIRSLTELNNALKQDVARLKTKLDVKIVDATLQRLKGSGSSPTLADVERRVRELTDVHQKQIDSFRDSNIVLMRKNKELSDALAAKQKQQQPDDDDDEADDDEGDSSSSPSPSPPSSSPSSMEVKKLQNEISELKETLGLVRAEANRVTQDLAAANAEISQFKKSQDESAQSNKAQVDRIRSESALFETHFKLAQAEATRWKSEWESLSLSARQAEETTSKRLSDLRSEVDRLQLASTEANLQLDSVQRELNKEKDRAAEIKAKFEGDVRVVQDAHDALLIQLRRSNEQLDALRSRSNPSDSSATSEPVPDSARTASSSSASSEPDPTLVLLAQLRSRITQLEDERHQLQDQADEIKSQLAASEAKVVSEQTSRQATEKDIIALKDQLTVAEAAKQSLTSQLASAQEDVRRLTLNLATATHLVEAKDAQLAERNTAIQLALEREKELENKSRLELQAMRAARQTAESQVSELSARVATLERDLSAENQARQADLERFRSESEAYVNKVKQFKQQAEAQIAALTEQVQAEKAAREAEAAGHSTSMAVARAENLSLSSDLQRTADSLADTKRQLEASQREWTSQKEQLQAALTQAREDLEDEREEHAALASQMQTQLERLAELVAEKAATLKLYEDEIHRQVLAKKTMAHRPPPVPRPGQQQQLLQPSPSSPIKQAPAAPATPVKTPSLSMESGSPNVGALAKSIIDKMRSFNSVSPDASPLKDIPAPSAGGPLLVPVPAAAPPKSADARLIFAQSPSGGVLQMTPMGPAAPMSHVPASARQQQQQQQQPARSSVLSDFSSVDEELTVSLSRRLQKARIDNDALVQEIKVLRRELDRYRATSERQGEIVKLLTAATTQKLDAPKIRQKTEQAFEQLQAIVTESTIAYNRTSEEHVKQHRLIRQLQDTIERQTYEIQVLRAAITFSGVVQMPTAAALAPPPAASATAAAGATATMGTHILPTPQRILSGHIRSAMPSFVTATPQRQQKAETSAVVGAVEDLP